MLLHPFLASSLQSPFDIIAPVPQVSGRLRQVTSLAHNNHRVAQMETKPHAVSQVLPFNTKSEPLLWPCSPGEDAEMHDDRGCWALQIIQI
jgi:hypothetical protein